MSYIFCAASSDPSLPADKILAAICREFGGKSGGRVDFAQGGGAKSFDVERAYQIIEEILSSKTQPCKE